MPAEGELTPSQLGILVGWLNAHFVPLQSVAVAEDTVRLGDTKFPKVTFTPGNASNQGYTLVSFDTSVTTPTGIRIHGAFVGSANVGLTTEEGAKTKTFKVTVIPWPVDSLVGADTSFQVGDTVIPRVGAFPEEATNKSYTLTSLAVGVTVLPGGKLTATALGSVKVVATSVQNPSVKDTFTVVVGPVPVQSVSAADMSLFVGTTKAPTLTWTPGAATNKGYTLSLVSGTGATLVGTTQLSGTTAGTSVWRVTTTDGAKTADFNVTVGNVVATGIKQTLNSLVYINSNYAPSVAWTPSTTTIKTYTLSTLTPATISLPSATVFKGLARGVGKIVATATDGPKDTLTVDVLRPPYSTVAPILVTYCSTCHKTGNPYPIWTTNPTSNPSYTSEDSARFINNPRVLNRLNADPGYSLMPPSASPQPTTAELNVLKQYLSW